MRRRTWLFAAVCVAGAAVALTLGVAKKGKPDAGATAVGTAAAEVLPVETTVLKTSGSYDVSERFVGRVVASRKSNLGFERAGTVKRIDVEEGDRVRKGALLASLDTSILAAKRRELDAQLAQARATHEETRAHLDYARATVKRRGELVRDSHVSKQSYDEALYDERALAAKLQATEATVASVRAEIGTLDVELARSRLIAPFNGTIIARNADEGTAVDAGTTLLSLIEDDSLEVKIGVSETVAGTLEPGRVYDVHVDGQVHPVALRAVLPNIDPETRTVQAVFVLAAADGAKLRSGQLATLEVRRRIDKSGFWLPVSALTSARRGLWNVYAVVADPRGDGNLRVERRDVQVVYSESERAFVRGTLRDGERVVTTGLQRLVPGQIVKLP